MTNNLLNGGQVIVDYLVREKVPYVFGLCGHGNIGLLDALFERAADIKTISVHHETVSGFMADVYYRVAGKPVATFTSCGPGSANLPVALAVPFDIFKEAAAEETPRPEDWCANISSRCGADPEGVVKAVDMLLAAERPVILVGQGVRYGGGAADLQKLAERLQIPVGAS